MLKVANTRFIELTVPAGVSIGTSIKFPTDDELNLKSVSALESYDDGILVRTPANAPVVTLAKGAAVVLFLYDNNKAKFYGLPYNSINTTQNSGILRQFKDLNINLNKSYIMITSVAAIVAGDALAFSFMYDYQVS